MHTAVLIPGDNLTAQRMNKLHREITTAQISAKEKAAILGDMLIAQKGKLKHGEYLPWIEENCEFAVYTAQEYMRVAKSKSGERPAFDQCTSIREVLALGKTPRTPKTDPASPAELSMMRKLKTLADHPSTDQATAEATRRKLEGYCSPMI